MPKHHLDNQELHACLEWAITYATGSQALDASLDNPKFQEWIKRLQYQAGLASLGRANWDLESPAEEEKMEGLCDNQLCLTEWTNDYIGHKCDCGAYIWHLNDYQQTNEDNAADAVEFIGGGSNA